MVHAHEEVEKVLQQRIQEMAFLNSLGQKINAKQSLAETAEVILEEVSSFTSADFTVLFLARGDDLLHLQTYSSKPGLKKIERHDHHLGQCLCGIAGQGTPTYSLDIHRDHRCTLEECKVAGIQSFAALPLIHKTKVLGVLGLASTFKKDFEKQADFLEAVTNQVAGSFQNTLMFEQLRQQHEQELRYVTELKIARDSLSKSKELLQSINRAQSEFMADTSTHTLFDNLLDDLLSVTESEYGFIGEILYNNAGDPYLKTHAITNIFWNHETEDFYEKNAPHGMEFSNVHTLFGEVLTTGKPVIVNFPATDPRAGGIPKGHPPLNAFLGAPFSIGETLIGMVGIANRPDGYDEEIIEFLSPFLMTCARIFESYRQEQQRLKAEIDKEKIEQQLRQTQKMEAIGTLAGGIAHDFNNLLNAIFGFADLLLMDLQEGTQQYNSALQIKSAGKRATELVQQILAFSRRDEQELQPVRLQSVIKEVMKLLRSTLPTTMEIRQDIHSDCSLVLADFTQIHQVIMNLCTNAFHAMPDEQGTLEVRLTEISVDQELASYVHDLSEGRYVRLIVKDSGHGMDKIRMERIFEPYFTTKKQGEGTGLGLATVLGIVKSHNGAITGHSKSGHGTTFTVYFPVAERDTAPSRESEERVELPQLGGRILFVDDVEFNVLLGKTVLERLGCQTTGVTNSLEALALFRRHPDKFDIVITDQTMPNLTGYELAKEIFKIRAGMPIIIITGHSDIVDEKKVKEIGVLDLFMKPLDMNKLAKSISKVLRG